MSCKPPFLGSKILKFPGCFPAKVRTIYFRRGELAGSFRFFVVPPNMVVSYTRTGPFWGLVPRVLNVKNPLKVLNLQSQETPPACSCQVTSRASSGAGPGSHLRLMVAALKFQTPPKEDRTSVSQTTMKDLGGVFFE